MQAPTDLFDCSQHTLAVPTPGYGECFRKCLFRSSKSPACCLGWGCALYWAGVKARDTPWTGDVFPKWLVFACLLPLALSLSPKLPTPWGPSLPLKHEATFNYLASLPAPDFATSHPGGLWLSLCAVSLPCLVLSWLFQRWGWDMEPKACWEHAGRYSLIGCLMVGEAPGPKSSELLGPEQQCGFNFPSWNTEQKILVHPEFSNNFQ